MENFWKWVARIAWLIAIFLFLKSWRNNMESIRLFWDNLTPWQFIFFLVLITAFFALWRWRLKVNENKDKKIGSSTKASINSNRPIEIIRNPDGYQYLVEGNKCSHVPDPPTFEYLGRFFGFSWADSKPMLSEDIKSKFVMGKQLPSILSHCPKTESKI